MQRHALQVRTLTPRRPKDSGLVWVVAAFIGFGAAALAFGWLEQPDEFRRESGTLTSVQPRRPDSRALVSFVKLDDGRVVPCSHLASLAVGSRVIVSIAKTGFLGREIIDC